MKIKIKIVKDGKSIYKETLHEDILVRVLKSDASFKGNMHVHITERSLEQLVIDKVRTLVSSFYNMVKDENNHIHKLYKEEAGNVIRLLCSPSSGKTFNAFLKDYEDKIQRSEAEAGLEGGKEKTVR